MTGVKQSICGNEIDKMPPASFRVMKFLFKILYFLRPVDKYIRTFGIQPGYTVVDYGCGPGAYVRQASILAGKDGLVYAVDIHELAVASVNDLIEKFALSNVKTVLTNGITISIGSDSADLVFAIDMFHMVKEPVILLKELNRIVKPGGLLIIEDGHQSRILSRQKILSSGCWEIIEENKRNIRCMPIRI